ncbi:GL24562 [Drosophila persimilis]|uniref:GL24562 n=1 Tax=Drosophila persimilis TaxID=7234 RepID=B4HBS2_DROPE|nr:GL24562 [Drosophila persimilis]
MLQKLGNKQLQEDDGCGDLMLDRHLVMLIDQLLICRMVTSSMRSSAQLRTLSQRKFQDQEMVLQ